MSSNLRRDLLANLRYRLENMPEVDGGDVSHIRIEVDVDDRNGRVKTTRIDLGRRFDAAPPGIVERALLDNG